MIGTPKAASTSATLATGGSMLAPSHTMPMPKAIKALANSVLQISRPAAVHRGQVLARRLGVLDGQLRPGLKLLGGPFLGKLGLVARSALPVERPRSQIVQLLLVLLGDSAAASVSARSAAAALSAVHGATVQLASGSGFAAGRPPTASGHRQCGRRFPAPPDGAACGRPAIARGAAEAPQAAAATPAIAGCRSSAAARAVLRLDHRLRLGGCLGRFAHLTLQRRQPGWLLGVIAARYSAAAGPSGTALPSDRAIGHDGCPRHARPGRWPPPRLAAGRRRYKRTGCESRPHRPLSTYGRPQCTWAEGLSQADLSRPQ